MTRSIRSKFPRHALPVDHPTAVAFLDESGTLSNDRFFAVGCLKVREPARLLRQVQKLRDREHWYREIHFAGVTRGGLPLYRKAVDTVAGSDAEFSCFVADRERSDPVARFGSRWKAYESLAAQLLLGCIQTRELMTVLADDCLTPDHVHFEQDLRAQVNDRLGRLGITSVCRLDSKSADPLQLADLLTSAVASEFRLSAGLGARKSPKAALARYVRSAYGISSALSGWDGERIKVRIYDPSSGETRGPLCAYNRRDQLDGAPQTLLSPNGRKAPLSRSGGRGGSSRVLDRHDGNQIRLFDMTVDDDHPGPGTQDEPMAFPSALQAAAYFGEDAKAPDRPAHSLTGVRGKFVAFDERVEVLGGRAGDYDPGHSESV